MNNRGQNVNPNGTPQNHHPNQGNPQLNNQNQGNVYNGQNPQNFNRNVNNQNPYQNQNSQANNVNNPQYSNGQNQPHNNMNNPQYRGQGYNGQNQSHNSMNNPQYNNMNNPQYRGQGNNAQNPQFGNLNNPQFSNQNGYNNPNQFNSQFGNNQNFNPINRRPKMNSKMVGYITAAVTAIAVVLMIFMFSSSSGKPGGATPEEAVRNVIAAAKDGDFEKAVNNTYFESDEARSKALEELDTDLTSSDIESAEIMGMIEIGEVELINENRAKVELKANGNELLIKRFDGNSTKTTYVKKVNGRWFVEQSFV